VSDRDTAWTTNARPGRMTLHSDRECRNLKDADLICQRDP